jgi:hypothetical protein
MKTQIIFYATQVPLSQPMAISCQYVIDFHQSSH